MRSGQLVTSCGSPQHRRDPGAQQLLHITADRSAAEVTPGVGRVRGRDRARCDDAAAAKPLRDRSAAGPVIYHRRSPPGPTSRRDMATIAEPSEVASRFVDPDSRSARRPRTGRRGLDGAGLRAGGGGAARRPAIRCSPAAPPPARPRRGRCLPGLVVDSTIRRRSSCSTAPPRRVLATAAAGRARGLERGRRHRARLAARRTPPDSASGGRHLASGGERSPATRRGSRSPRTRRGSPSTCAQARNRVLLDQRQRRTIAPRAAQTCSTVRLHGRLLASRALGGAAGDSSICRRASAS